MQLYGLLTRVGHRIKQFFIPFVLVSTSLLVWHLLYIQSSVICFNLVPYDDDHCGCPRWAPPTPIGDNGSLCNDYSTTRGKNQKIVSFIVYGNQTNANIARKYYNQMQARIDEVTEFYEGWVVRLYHNKAQKDSHFHDFVCSLYCKNPNFDACRVGKIIVPRWFESKRDTSNQDKPYTISPIVNSNHSSVSSKPMVKATTQPSVEATTQKVSDFLSLAETTSENIFTAKLIVKTWRYLVMADQLVSEFLIRDVDSFILPREVMAVRQWLETSNAGLHVMRDHPWHGVAMLAGMWGGSRKILGPRFDQILKNMLDIQIKYAWSYDQAIIRDHLWPHVQDSILSHDSYFCKSSFAKIKREVPSVPFPSQRNGSLFIGWGPERKKRELAKIKACPAACRPVDHQEWTYC